MPIQSIHRATAILDLYSGNRSLWGITEISLALDLHKSTVSSIVRTMEHVGLLGRDFETRKYRLGHKVMRYGVNAASTLRINQCAVPLLEKLSIRTGFPSNVAIWDEDAILVTLEVSANRISMLANQIGPRVSAYCAALGRVFLAHFDGETVRNYLNNTVLERYTPQTVTDPKIITKELAGIKSKGYALLRDQIATGFTSMAAPVFQSDGTIVATICLYGRSEAFFDDIIPYLKTSLLKTAQSISSRMGFSARTG